MSSMKELIDDLNKYKPKLENTILNHRSIWNGDDLPEIYLRGESLSDFLDNWLRENPYSDAV